MKLKFLNILIILSLLYFIMSDRNGNNFSQIEYRQRIISKYDKSLTFISFKFNKKEKVIKAQYQKGKAKLEIDPNTFSFVDKTGNEGLKNFELTYEELDLKSNEEMFNKFNEINFPEENDFRTAQFPDFPVWHIIVDTKDYQGNVNIDFYDKFNEIINIKKIEEYIINKYNS